MKINGKPYRTIWPREDGTVEIIDQTKLPHRFETVVLKSVDDAAHAIKAMVVRGAPLIGATAAYGMAVAKRADASDEALDRAYEQLLATRPTAVNLHWALKRMRDALRNHPRGERAALAWKEAAAIALREVTGHLNREGVHVRHAIFVLFGRSAYEVYAEALGIL